jgi:hypothetical protein
MDYKKKYEELREEYLLNCKEVHDNNCGGDPSVGVFPCRYFQAPDIDDNGNHIPAICLLNGQEV